MKSNAINSCCFAGAAAFCVALTLCCCPGVAKGFGAAGLFGNNKLSNPSLGTTPASAKKKKVDVSDPSKRILKDDPAVKDAEPPAKTARLVTKVGWCEVQLFGHTYSDYGLINANLPAEHLHLPARLQQINNKIQFKPGKSGAQLMDDIDSIVEFVQTHKDTAATSKK